MTFLTTPDFKNWLALEATKTGADSVGDFIRLRCQNAPSEEDMLFSAMARDIREATRRASAALDKGLSEVNSVLAELASKRKERKG